MMHPGAWTPTRMGKLRILFARQMSASQCSHTVGIIHMGVVYVLLCSDVLNRIPHCREIEIYVFLFWRLKKEINKTIVDI
jgi:hypothetical protein